MSRRPGIVISLFILLALALAPCIAQASSNGSGSGKAAVKTIPDGSTPEQIRDIMASMSDEQVRDLLIAELSREAKAAKPKEPEEQGLAGMVREMKTGAAFVRERFEYLFSGASTAPRELPERLSGILSGSGNLTPGRMLLGLVVLSVLWLGALRLFKAKTRSARMSIAATAPNAAWYTRMGRLFLRALLDFSGVIMITVVVLICYLTLFSEGSAAKPVLLSWLLAMFFLEMVKLVSRFLLAPHAPSLRYLPLSDHAAQYIFRWTLNVARVMAFGLLVTTLLRLDGGSEALSLLVNTFVGFIIAFMLVLLALWNKKPVADAIQAGGNPESLAYQFAPVWHVGAITYVLGFWMFWVLGLMIFGTEALLPGVITLLIVPAYFLLNWATQKLVSFAVDMAGEAVPDHGHEDDEEGESVSQSEKPAITKFQSFLSKSFRVLVFAACVFILLRAWGVDLTFGREVVRAAMNTLIALVLAYIFWVFVSKLIERKLREKEGDQGGDHGEGDGGGPGGDRFSTLLQLLRKFIFAAITVVTTLIVLSSVGVDVGPLIAGASVFGIAIGFGAQTLVKDIISGIFFLMDDAFRVGDYIETGNAMGTVEEITVRSIKLRHHLGFLYTIPFGSMKLVKNNTRDWAVMKLQYLVPFDTDIQKVKKIIKKINKEIRAIPELDEMMLADIKSQGVKAMEEYGMRMRVKFMTKPGGQFTLRKLVLAKMRNYFEEEGIEFAKPRVAVSVPDGSQMTEEERALVAAAASKATEKKKAKSSGEDHSL